MTHVAIVCWGNYCRSPMAETVFRARISDVEFSSAGLAPHRLGGRTMSHETAALLTRRGYPTDHVCRGVSGRTLGADLILVMDGDQAELLELLGAPADRVRTLTDLDPLSPDGETVANPYTRHPGVHEHVLDLIERCVPTLADLLGATLADTGVA